MKILEFITPSNIGGAENYVVNLSKKFAEKGHEVFILSSAGESTDDTKKELERLRDENPKIKLIDSDWNVIKKSGSIMSEKTNIAIKEITGDYGLYVQCDEGIHEKDYDKITRVLKDNINNRNIKGFVFDYIHFFGGYFSYAKKSEKKFFYDKEVRIIRNDGTVFSWGDAMGFKDAGRVKIEIFPFNSFKPAEIGIYIFIHPRVVVRNPIF